VVGGGHSTNSDLDDNERSVLEGGTSRKGHLCTLRTVGGDSGASERSEATLDYPLIGVPGVISGEVDVLPAKRRDVLKQGRIELP